MTRPIVVLRPQPGHDATLARLAAAGLESRSLPLFAVRTQAWAPPDPEAFDGLLLTSANAVRCAGPGLAALYSLPVLAVGSATAAAARAAGMKVVLTGGGDASALLAAPQATGYRRLLHLAGRDRREAPSTVAETIIVYASDPLPVDDARVRQIQNNVVLVHSPRAAAQLDRLAFRADVDRRTVRLAATSPAAARAAGADWATIAIAPAPNDAAMVALAGRLAD